MTSIGEIIRTVRKGAEFVESIRPVAVALGGPLVGKAIDAIAAVTDVANNVQTRVREGEIAASTNDEAELRSLLERIQRENDQLAEYINSH